MFSPEERARMRECAARQILAEHGCVNPTGYDVMQYVALLDRAGLPIFQQFSRDDKAFLKQIHIKPQ